jgi:hypothetical protein
MLIDLLIVVRESPCSLFLDTSVTYNQPTVTYLLAYMRSQPRPTSLSTDVVLIADLLVPVAELVSGVASVSRTPVIIASSLAVLPLASMKSLHALRFTSFLCIGSVAILLLVMAYRMASCRDYDDAGGGGNRTTAHLEYCLNMTTAQANTLQLWPDNVMDLIYCWSIFPVAFLCHFNCLPVHSELHRPTRSRMSKVTRYTMGTCSVLYIAVGLCGYFYAPIGPCGNVLKNFAGNDPVISVGRVALACTLLLSFPLLVLPCRDACSCLISAVVDTARRSCCVKKDDFDLMREPMVNAEDLEDHRAVSSTLNSDGGDIASPPKLRRMEGDDARAAGALMRVCVRGERGRGVYS